MAKKPEMLFGMMLGDSSMRVNEEDEGVEPEELGTRMVEHGERVSESYWPQFGVVFDCASHFILQKK